MDRRTVRSAAKKGRLWVLKWLLEEGCLILDADICSAAASGGHLHVLDWAKEMGCPWDMELCAQAADNGHLDVLKWAKKVGCPWDGETRKCAQVYAEMNEGGKEMLNWVITNS